MKGAAGAGAEMRKVDIPAKGTAVALTRVTLPDASAMSSMNDADVFAKQPGGYTAGKTLHPPTQPRNCTSTAAVVPDDAPSLTRLAPTYVGNTTGWPSPNSMLKI